jgi:hypothetical protein
MIYQMIIKHLKDMQKSGTDIGTAIHYCTDNIFDLLHMHEAEGVSISALVNICVKYGTQSDEV